MAPPVTQAFNASTQEADDFNLGYDNLTNPQTEVCGGARAVAAQVGKAN